MRFRSELFGVRRRFASQQIVRRLRIGTINRHEHRNRTGPFDMLEKAEPESFARVRAFDDAGDVGDHKGAMVRESDDAEVWLQRRERIVSDLGAGGRDHREQRALAGVRLAEQPDVGDELEDELEAPLLACFSRLPFARRLVCRSREVLIAAPAAAALRNEQGLIGHDQLAEDLAGVGVAHLGPRGKGEVDVLRRFPRHVLPFTMLAALRHPAGVVAVVEQRSQIRIDFEVNASARPPVAAKALLISLTGCLGHWLRHASPRRPGGRQQRQEQARRLT